MKQIISIGFIGSKPRMTGNVNVTDYLEEFLTQIIEKYKHIRIINGGSKGIMEDVSKVAKRVVEKKNFIKKSLSKKLCIDDSFYVESYDVLFINNRIDSSEKSDHTINTDNIGERTQSIIDMSDIIFALPGRKGTLHEILHIIEHIQYNSPYDFSSFFLHEFWKPVIQYLSTKSILNEKIVESINFIDFSQFDVVVNKLPDYTKALSPFSNPKLHMNRSSIDDFAIEESPLWKIMVEDETGSANDNGQEIDDYTELFNNVNVLLSGTNKRNEVFGIDNAVTFSSKTSNESSLKVNTVGILPYCASLNKYLERSKSILFSNTPRSETKVRYLNSIFEPNVLDNAPILIFPIKEEIIDNLKKHSTEAFENWLTHLEKNNLGRTAILRNIFLEIPNKGITVELSAFILLKVYLPRIKQERLINIIDDFLLKQNINTILIQYEEKVLYLMNEAKIATILARNFSHHIGAHVSEGVKISAIRKRLGNMGLYSPELIDKFLNYTKNKMDDYITSRNNFLSNPLPLMKNVKLYRDVILPFTENVLLIDNLASGENLGFYKDVDNNWKSRIQIKVYYNNGKVNREIFASYGEKGEISYPENFPYDLNVKENPDIFTFLNCKEVKFADTKNKFTDLQVAIPHEHAVFSILENIIRNSAKHNKKAFDKNKDLKLVISLNIVDEPKLNFYKISIFDNVSNIDNGIKRNEIKQMQKLTLDKIQDKNWGILDMKICAQLLTGSNDFNFDQKEGDSPLKISFTKENLLVYTITINKPSNLCIIGKIAPEDPKNLSNEGVCFFKNMDEYLKIGANSKYMFALIYPDAFDSSNKDFEMFINKIPFRSLVVGRENFEIYEIIRRVRFIDEDKINYYDIKTLIEECWKIWISKYDQKNIELHLYFQQNEDEKPTLNWLNCMKEWNKDNSKFKIITRFDCDNRGISSRDENGNIISFDNHKEYIIYDRHGNSIEGYDVDIPKNISYELLDKSSKDFNSIFETNPAENKYAPYELLESGLLKILILDERLTDVSKEELIDSVYADYKKIQNMGFWDADIDKITRFDIAWASRIYIATEYSIDGKIFNLVKDEVKNQAENYNEYDHFLKVDFSKNKIQIETNLATLSGKRDFDFDVIIIHRGVADRMMDEDDRILGNLKKMTDKIYIDTGSGELHGNNTRNFEYLSFDFLKEAISYSRINKKFLVQQMR